MKYIVIHHHPEKLIVPPNQRELLFSTGKLLQFIESDLYSVQPEYLQRIELRPLTIILWGVEDRYDVLKEMNLQSVTVKNWNEAYQLCRLV